MAQEQTQLPKDAVMARNSTKQGELLPIYLDFIYLHTHMHTCLTCLDKYIYWSIHTVQAESISLNQVSEEW